MQQTIQIGSAVHCADGKAGSVCGIVLDPHTNCMEYLVVHRGLLIGHDHCVPAGHIRATSPEAVELTINCEALKEMPDVEVKMPGDPVPHRSIPEHCFVLTKGTSIQSTEGGLVGHLGGVVIDEQRQVERILLKEGNDTIPLSQVAGYSEQEVTVQPATTMQPATTPPLAAAETGAPPAPSSAGQDLSTPATAMYDPVCDRGLEPETAAAKSEFRGTTYYFCSLNCKQLFDDNPLEWVNKQRTSGERIRAVNDTTVPFV